MKAKRVRDSRTTTFVLVFNSGDEVMRELLTFAKQNALTGSQFTAIGAFERAVIGYFDWARKDYERIPITEQVEVLSLIGDVALADGEPKIHAHVVVGKRDGSAHGGHLLEGYVRPTLEVVLIESPVSLRRRMDTTSGIPLIDLES